MLLSIAVWAVVREVVQFVTFVPAAVTRPVWSLTAVSVLADEMERLVLVVLWVVMFPARLVRLASKLLDELLSQLELLRRVTKVAELEILPFPPNATVIDELIVLRAVSTLVDDVALLLELLMLVVIAALVLVNAVSTLVDEVA
jgi:hypothetical protein